MMFAKPLRERVRSGEITTSVRIWLTPRVKVGGRYRLLDGFIEVTRLQEVDLDDVTEAMAREGGFESLEALMKTARHGRGERVFIVDFVWVSGSGG
ncbi:MAG: ASCH domain-containing protein [Phenylobacterium sp.]|uniref:ASCH domain-containing protein n=2 Tax=Phenylobacterium sp. TaxID=1871053 RepID=UPI00120C20C0|nr:ASCH domain-containing protein [Phenylobacterium sp.]TAL35770.1 MAG: ASCH domain-containing protein [Phenylobacterium sp.]